MLLHAFPVELRLRQTPTFAMHVTTDPCVGLLLPVPFRASAPQPCTLLALALDLTLFFFGLTQ